jgi:hypothetical protein
MDRHTQGYASHPINRPTLFSHNPTPSTTTITIPPPHKKKQAYCLSPLIYSATVKLHPVLIVAALYMMEHLAGLQGVFLAVPITMFVIKQVIFGNNGSVAAGVRGAAPAVGAEPASRG